MLTSTDNISNSNVVLPYEKVGTYTIENLGDIPKRPFFCFVKRMVDFIASFFALVLLAVPMLVIAIIVKVTSEGPAFYTQDRLGLNGKTMRIIKFRTMRNDAEKDGAQWSSGKDDPRITRVGAFLRKTRLDELPQFINILKGDMSLVGPRPERAVFYEEFETYIHGFSQRMLVKPGLTGLAQVNGGYDLKPEEKIVYDIEYIKNRSVLMDISIIFKTISVVFTGDGAK